MKNIEEILALSEGMLSEHEERVVSELQHGLPLTSRPYATIGARIGMGEAEVLSVVRRLKQFNIIKRYGVVVRHHELGYRANAMAIWDVPDEVVDSVGQLLSTFKFVTLCYKRARHLPEWRFNLYCMIHGREQQAVHENIEQLIDSCNLQEYPHDVLFSGRRFKQRGAIYQQANADDDLLVYKMGRSGS